MSRFDNSKSANAFALTGSLVFDGTRFLTNHAVVVAGGIIQAALPAQSLDTAIRQVNLNGGILAPGFIDAQVNGGGGVLLNDNPSVEGIAAIVKAHRRFGTTGLLPTLITDKESVMRSAVAAAEAAIRTVPGCLGLHLEGPFLAPSRKGAHLASLMREMTKDDVAWLSGIKTGRLLLTLATEQASPLQIKALTKAGVIVSLGHSDATQTDASEAFAAGATGVTHLYNAMSQTSSREPALAGTALNTGHVWCAIIADGHHVHPENIKLALRAKKGPGRVFLVSDAMSSVGSKGDHFSLNGRTIHRKAGRLTLEGGTLAGSDLDMAGAVRYCIKTLELPVRESLRMASLYPARFLGLSGMRGRIKKGMIADLVHLDENYVATRTWIAGQAWIAGQE